MEVRSTRESPLNERGGQRSYLLLDAGEFGSRNLSITWVDCPPGSGQAVHAHEASEQVYVIVRGRGVMQVGSEEREVAEGTMVFIPPGSGHAIRNTGDAMLTYVSATSPPFDAAALDAQFAYRAQP